MSKSPHPDRELFGYLSGSMDAQRVQAVDHHLEQCGECRLFVDSVRGLRSVPELAAASTGEHPTVAELAEFFYDSGRRKNESDASRSYIPAHVAICDECSVAIAQYAQAEAAASRFEATKGSSHAIPEAAWQLIRDWEESPFAGIKDPAQAAPDLLTRLSALIAQEDAASTLDKYDASTEVVPVRVIDSLGRVLRVELFRRVSGGFKHEDESGRWNEKPVHAVLEFSEGHRVLISDLVRGDRIELKQEHGTASLVRADYFIVEE